VCPELFLSPEVFPFAPAPPERRGLGSVTHLSLDHTLVASPAVRKECPKLSPPNKNIGGSAEFRFSDPIP